MLRARPPMLWVKQVSPRNAVMPPQAHWAGAPLRLRASPLTRGPPVGVISTFAVKLVLLGQRCRQTSAKVQTSASGLDAEELQCMCLVTVRADRFSGLVRRLREPAYLFSGSVRWGTTALRSKFFAVRQRSIVGLKFMIASASSRSFAESTPRALRCAQSPCR